MPELIWSPNEFVITKRIYVRHAEDFLMPFYLFKFEFTSPVFYTDTDITVTWSGDNYEPVPISVGGFGKSSTNFSETLTIATQNVDRAIAAIVLNEEVQGKAATIYRTAWMAPGSYSNPVIVFQGQIDGFNIEEKYDTADVTMEIKNDFVRWDRTVPRSNFGGNCQWVFKSTTPGCQYTGVASLCNKTWERCVDLANTHRFRGFRWLPMLEDKEIWWGRGQNPARPDTGTSDEFLG